MNEDFEKEQNNGPESQDGFQHRDNPYGRTPRPRINRPSQTGEYNHGYSNYYSDNRRQGYRPRYNQGGDEQGEYRPRQNYGRPGGGYRPQGYGQQGGYRPRYNQQQGGYRPRPNYNREEGAEGYTPREGYVPRENRYGERRPYRPYQENNYGRGGNGFNRNRAQQRGGYNPHKKYSQKKQLIYKEENIDPDAPIRLNKYLANAGICSRRDADKYIEAGVITVNGEVVTELGTKVLRSDNIMFHETPVKIEHKVYVLLNKPKGYVTTSEDPQNRKTVMDLVRGACPERIYPVGRLDRQTTGVLLLTNDGELAAKLTHPQFLKKKIYHVWLDHNLTASDMKQIAEGIQLDDGEIKADDIQYVNEADKKQVGIEIHSGRNRIVRRMFEALGYHVTKLDRVFFAGLTKKQLRRGDWRFLTQEEVNFLRMGSFE